MSNPCSPRFYNSVNEFGPRSLEVSVQNSYKGKGVREGVIMRRTGHVSRAMAELYAHVRMDAMRKAVESLALTKPKPPEEKQIPPSRDSAKVSGSIAIQ